jgi:hypothetical protein
MKIRRAILASLLAFPNLAIETPAQPCPVTPFAPNYTATPMPSAFSSILGNPAAMNVFVSMMDDESSSPIVLPPAGFNFYGASRLYFQVNVNGFLGFDQFLGTCCFTAVAPGTVGTPEDYIGPWWDDLHTSSAGSVWYLALPNGDVIVEWNTMEAFPANMSGENATFQARFNAAPVNTIEFHYDPASFATGPPGIWAAVVGVENATGATGFDVTGLAAANGTFPPTDFTLTFQAAGPPQVFPGYNSTVTPVGMTSISGQPGEVVVFNSGVAATCTTGCTNIFDDDFAGPVAIPFPFQYFGQAVTQFWIDTNGFVRFQSPPVCGDFTNAGVGTTGAAGRAAPFWDDLKGSTTSTGKVSYLVSGPGGSQTMTIEWKDLETWTGTMMCADNGSRLNFQLVLHQSTNDIELKYGAFIFGTSPAPSGTIGVTNLAGTSGHDPSGLGPTAPFPTTENYLLTPCVPCGFAINFGTPCPSTAGTSGGLPVSGNAAFTLTQSGAPAGAPGFLLMGLSNTVWTLPPPIPLPLPLSTFGFGGGCSLRVSADILIPIVTSPTGTTSVNVPIPPGLAPCAATVYAQWANVVVGAPLAIQTSDGLQVVTG